MSLTEIREHANMEFDALTRRHEGMIDSLRGPRKIPSYEVLFDGVNLPESLQNAPGFLVPTKYLHGIQLPEEYSTGKRRQIEAHLAEEGIVYLLRHPIVVCMLTDPQGATLAIFDGHHRERFSPKYGIHLIPTIVTRPVDLVRILHSAGKSNMSTEAFTNYIRESVDDTLIAFDERMPSFKRPRIIEGIISVDQLRKVFVEF